MTNHDPPKPLVISETPVTLIGPGPGAARDIDELLTLAPCLVAADGGAEVALVAGRMPEAVIGDLDSLPQSTRDRLPAERLHRIEEQDTTDFEKCLARIRAPAILAAGFTGGRIDHGLAVLSALVAQDSRCIVAGDEDVVCHLPREAALDLPVGSRISLFPLAAVTGRSVGLEWPIDGLNLAPGGRIGTSNRVTGPVRLSFDNPGMLLITPRAALRAVLTALVTG